MTLLHSFPLFFPFFRLRFSCTYTMNLWQMIHMMLFILLFLLSFFDSVQFSFTLNVFPSLFFHLLLFAAVFCARACVSYAGCIVYRFDCYCSEPSIVSTLIIIVIGEVYLLVIVVVAFHWRLWEKTKKKKINEKLIVVVLQYSGCPTHGSFRFFGECHCSFSRKEQVFRFVCAVFFPFVSSSLQYNKICGLSECDDDDV